MPGSNKRPNYFILSSDSESSDNEDGNSSQNRTAKKKSHGNVNDIINNEGAESSVNTVETQENVIGNHSTGEGIDQHDVIEGMNTTRELIQTTIDGFLNERNNVFNNINDLVVNQQRCKVLNKSTLRVFQGTNKVFQGIICDDSGEIKVIAFNQDAERLYDSMVLNETITITNGNVKLSNPNYRTAFSMYEILLLPDTIIRIYRSNNFHPTMKITKQSIVDVQRGLHGSLVDIEATIVMDRGVNTSTSLATNEVNRRKSVKVNDETGNINVTFWNEKIDELPGNIMNKKIRIRNGKINHYNDFVSINISNLSMIDFS